MISTTVSIVKIYSKSFYLDNELNLAIRYFWLVNFFIYIKYTVIYWQRQLFHDNYFLTSDNNKSFSIMLISLKLLYLSLFFIFMWFIIIFFLLLHIPPTVRTAVLPPLLHHDHAAGDALEGELLHVLLHGLYQSNSLIGEWPLDGSDKSRIVLYPRKIPGKKLSVSKMKGE